MPTLPWGFSPVNAVKQIGSQLNPTGGVADYDVFSQKKFAYGTPTSEGSSSTPRGSSPRNEAFNPTAGDGSSGGASAASIALYDQAIQQANSGIGRLKGQEGIGLENVANDYNSNLNRLLGAKSRTQRDYTTNKEQSTGDNLRARSDIDFSTGQRANSLQRLLGARGAGSSSAARIAAPYAAALEGTQQLNEVGDAFTRNMGALDTSWSDYQQEWDSSREDLDRQKFQQENAVRSDAAGKRAQLLSQLAELTAQRAQASGGDAAGSAQPYLDQVNDLYSQIDNFGRQYRGRVNVTDPNYVAPELDQYDYDARSAAQLGNGSAMSDATLPYLNLLLGNKDKKQSLV